jgi:hypothetical protein
MLDAAQGGPKDAFAPVVITQKLSFHPIHERLLNTNARGAWARMTNA